MRIPCLPFLLIASACGAQQVPDIAHLGTAPQSLEAFLNGFRAEPVSIQIENQVTHKMETCTIRFVMHESLRKRAPVLLLHGLTDTGSGYGYYVNRLIDQKKPYRDLVWFDWPRHGLSACDTVRSVPEAADAVRIAFDKLRAKYELPPPRAMLCHSMGNPMGLYMHPHYPDAHMYMIAMPILTKSGNKRMLGKVMAVSTPEHGQDFLNSTTKRNPIPYVPVLDPMIRGAVYGAMKDRIVHARVLVSQFDRDAAAKKMLELTPSQVDIILGRDDALTPPAELDPAIRKKFSSKIRIVDCGHNIHRDCPQFLPDNP